MALLEGFCRADSERVWESSCVELDDTTGVPISRQWQCSSSSFPLIQHLQLIGHLAGATVDLALAYKASTNRTDSDGREVRFAVDHWQLNLSWGSATADMPVSACMLAEPVDVSADIDARGYYEYEDDGRVYDITVADNGNFLTQRLSMTRLHSGERRVKAQPVWVGNCPYLYQAALSQNVAVQSISLLACHWCWEDGVYSEALYDMLLGSFGKLDHAMNERPYLDMLHYITTINDSLTHQRAVRLTHGNAHTHSKGLLALLLHIRHTQPRKTWAGVTLLLALARQMPNFAAHLADSRNDWLWIDAWMKDHSTRGKPKGILTASNTAPTQQDEDREAVWQQYETMVKALGHKLELPILHAPPPAIVMPGASGAVVNHHQLSRRLSAEDSGAGSGHVSPVAGQGRHRRSSQIDTRALDTTVAYSSNSTVSHPHYNTSKQPRKSSLNRTTEPVQPSQRASSQRSVDMPKLVAGQPSLARRFVSAGVPSRSQHESEDELESDDSDIDMRHSHSDVAATLSISKRQQHLHQSAQQAVDNDDIYADAEQDRAERNSMQGIAADEEDDMDESELTYQQDATALGDDDNDDDDEPTTSTAHTATAATVTSTYTNRTHRRHTNNQHDTAYNLSPNSQPIHRATNLQFEAAPPRLPSTASVGGKRRAPTTPVGVGGGRGVKGKGAPNSPASVGRGSRGGDGVWSVQHESTDGGSGSGSGSGSNGGGSGGAEIACGACTFLNPSHARVCEMCENSLP